MPSDKLTIKVKKKYATRTSLEKFSIDQNYTSFRYKILNSKNTILSSLIFKNKTKLGHYSVVDDKDATKFGQV